MSPPPTRVFSAVHGPSAAGVDRVTLVGDLDVAAAGHAADVIRRVQDEAGDVVCDLGYVSFIDLAGVQVLFDATAYARQRNARLIVANRPPLLPRILRLELELDGHPLSAADADDDTAGCAGATRRHAGRPSAADRARRDRAH